MGGLLERMPVVVAKFMCCISLRAGTGIIGALSLCALSATYVGNLALLLLRYADAEIDDGDV